jgi:hypothetical protein
VEFTQDTDAPVPVFVATIDVEKYAYDAPVDGIDLLESFGLLKRWPEFRAVSYDRLPVILKAGIDVEPASAPTFVADFEKSWEYGGWPKVIMALDAKQLERTYREIPADTPSDEVARLMQDYPTRFESETGEYLWLSRFSESDTRATSP